MYGAEIAVIVTLADKRPGRQTNMWYGDISLIRHKTTIPSSNACQLIYKDIKHFPNKKIITVGTGIILIKHSNLSFENFFDDQAKSSYLGITTQISVIMWINNVKEN